MTQKDTLMMQAVFAMAQGCSECQISDEACAWFYDRYYGWIDRAKENEKARGRSPQDVWDTEGQYFLAHFKEIGKRAASSSSGVIERESLEKSALSLETDLDCPYCPIRP